MNVNESLMRAVTVMTPYHEALLKCGQRYHWMMIEAEFPDDDPVFTFSAEFIDACTKGAPDRKLCRWLGYIQGVLIERGLTTVEAERDWTRPLFRPLDFPTESV